MSYAMWKPKNTPISLAIPPLAMSDGPLALYKNWTEKDIAAAKADFENRAANDFYAEWFWYPLPIHSVGQQLGSHRRRYGRERIPIACGCVSTVAAMLGRGLVVTDVFLQAHPGSLAGANALLSPAWLFGRLQSLMWKRMSNSRPTSQTDCTSSAAYTVSLYPINSSNKPHRSKTPASGTSNSKSPSHPSPPIQPKPDLSNHPTHLVGHHQTRLPRSQSRSLTHAPDTRTPHHGRQRHANGQRLPDREYRGLDGSSGAVGGVQAGGGGYLNGV